MKKTGAQIIADALVRQGVTLMFGYPGGAILPLTDVLMDTPIRFVLVRHEQAAAHAADGYARATGRVGVCLATSGPGATNLVTGLATAHMDSVPMVAITGQVKTALIGNDAFQEADVTGITRPVTKHNYLVKRIEDLACTIDEAFHIAGTGRPGPVVVDVPVDIQMQEYDEETGGGICLRAYRPTLEPDAGQIQKAAALINQSKKPIIYVGGGAIISAAHAELMALAEKIQAPVTTTLMGLGAFPDTHVLSVGMLGMHGTVAANHAIMESDVIIAVGARFDDRVTGRTDKFAPYAKIVHIDIDPTAISKNVAVQIPIVCDARRGLAALLPQLKAPDTTAWRQQVAEWGKTYPLRYQSSETKISPQYVVEQIYAVTGGQAIICTEVGQNQMWAAQYYSYTKPRSWISSGGLGTMGFGFPAAIGAKLAFPDRIVFDIAGDGSIQMNIQELATAVANKVAVKVAILNNGYLGMVRQWQELFYRRRYANTEITAPDFVKLAESYGAVGLRVEKTADVVPALKKALAIDNVVFLDFVVADHANVYPMVPAGEAINQMIGMA